jgi:hypothetical protein
MINEEFFLLKNLFNFFDKIEFNNIVSFNVF